MTLSLKRGHSWPPMPTMAPATPGLPGADTTTYRFPATFKEQKACRSRTCPASVETTATPCSLRPSDANSSRLTTDPSCTLRVAHCGDSFGDRLNDYLAVTLTAVDLFTAGDEQIPVSPYGVGGVGEADPMRVAAVPGILGCLHSCAGALEVERREGWPGFGHDNVLRSEVTWGPGARPAPM
jgi:hypothetical protein